MDRNELEHDRKRQRTAHACDSCRLRKTRCDGRNPCTTCSLAGNEECSYGHSSAPKGKSDLILHTVLRLEKGFQDLEDYVKSQLESRAVSNASHVIASPKSSSAGHSLPGTSGQHKSIDAVENAVIGSNHTSATEAVLSWPNFEQFPALTEHSTSIFHLEHRRSPLAQRPTLTYPFVNQYDVDRFIEAFRDKPNFWYPTVSLQQLSDIRITVQHGRFQYDTQSCLALLVMSLGAVSITSSGEQHSKAELDIGATYFDAAVKMLHVAHMEQTADAALCLFLAALYFAFLQRPLEAWSYINATATKARLLLNYPPYPEASESNESIRRIFWSCFILESDYLAELSHLPESGIAGIESTVPLPGSFQTHPTLVETERSTLYFLACISMRRLLNRVHHLLYAKEVGVSLDDERFPTIVAELNHQLEEWRSFLPTEFQFCPDLRESPNPWSGFLRQRYLTCKSVIYRPYLMWALSPRDSFKSDRMSEIEIQGCRKCLEACCLHILNLRGFDHTVMVDTWICALSMAGAMLVLLAACRIEFLRDCVPPEILSLGPHLNLLLRDWVRIPASGRFEEKSPSVLYSIDLIGKVERLIRAEYDTTPV